jgi:ACS family sodium-dependent inorganic phosphate cotransporter/ACS family sodium-dependent inorganic phosphate cotransporter-like MFS transporter 9
MRRRFARLLCVQGGVLADRHGGKVVIAVAIAFFSVATLLTPLSLSPAAVRAGLALPLMLAVRALVGLGEGVVLPAVTNMLSRSVPAARRASAVGTAFAGFHGGTILGLLLSPLIVQRLGWPGLFYVFGALGAPVLAFWNAVVPEHNAAAAGGQGPAAGPAPSAMLKSKAVWAIVVANSVNHCNYFIFLFMLPTYFSTFWHLNIRSSALYSLLPWLAMVRGVCVLFATHACRAWCVQTDANNATTGVHVVRGGCGGRRAAASPGDQEGACCTLSQMAACKS